MYTGISLSSGAARGIYQLGSLHAAECNHLLKDVKYYIGTSVGSMISLLLAVGWKPIDIFTHLCTDDISKHIDHTLDLTVALNTWGVFNPEKIKAYMSRMLISKWGGIPTFGDLHKNGITFICCAYRLKSKDPCVYFSYKTHANMSALEAVMLSVNIPFVFEAVKYDNSYYVDGGLFDLNPANYLETFLQEEVKEEKTQKILSISLGIRDVSDEISDPIKTILEYAREVLFVSMYQQKEVQNTKVIDSVFIKTIDPNNFSMDISNQTKIDWFCSGLQQGLDYFMSKPLKNILDSK